MNNLIGIIDYGAGNLGSVVNALKRLGLAAQFVKSPQEMNPANSPYQKIIFPGDGHFVSAMNELSKTGYDRAILEWIKRDLPFLGICIGLQLLFEGSEEAENTDIKGLSVIKGGIKKFPCKKVPQIAWNKTIPKADTRLFKGLYHDNDDNPYFYYIHSYYAAPQDDTDTAAYTEYSLKYCSAVERGALSAVQFHPEKSGVQGLRLLSNWAEDKKAVFSFPQNKQELTASAEKSIESGTNSKKLTLAKRIIPCLDVDDGRVVKGLKFKGIADVGDPIEMARAYNEGGADELLFLDIGASYKSRATLLELVRSVAAEVFIPLCVGGGIRCVDDMRQAMNVGADKVSVCTSALKRPELLSEMADAYGRQCVVLSIDAMRVSSPDSSPKWHAFTRGGRDDTGIDAVQWAIEACKLGAGEILLNSIDADGTGAGYDLELIRAVMDAVNVPVIASGGAGNLQQIASAAECADAALVASLLHFGKTTIRQIKDYCRKVGVSVR